MSLKTAVIDEDACIGCSRCLAPCPTDAIIGNNGYMHTVLYEACIGCKLCIPYCPAECITMDDLENYLAKDKIPAKEQQIANTRLNYKGKKLRLETEKQQANSLFKKPKTEQQQAIAKNLTAALKAAGIT